MFCNINSFKRLCSITILVFTLLSLFSMNIITGNAQELDNAVLPLYYEIITHADNHWRRDNTSTYSPAPNGIRVQGDGTNNNSRFDGYVQFDLSAIPETQGINTVVLEVYKSTTNFYMIGTDETRSYPYYDPINIQVDGITDDWTESDATATKAATTIKSNIATVPMQYEVNGCYKIDITDFALQKYNENKIVSLKFVSLFTNSRGNWVSLDSRENLSGNAPRLKIYTEEFIEQVVSKINNIVDSSSMLDTIIQYNAFLNLDLEGKYKSLRDVEPVLKALIDHGEFNNFNQIRVYFNSVVENLLLDEITQVIKTINEATVEQIGEVLIDNNDILMLDLIGDFNNLNDVTPVYDVLIGKNFSNITAIRDAFNEAVTFQKQVEQALSILNNAELDMVSEILKEYNHLFRLDLTGVYQKLIDKNTVHNSLIGKDFISLQQLKLVFNSIISKTDERMYVTIADAYISSNEESRGNNYGNSRELILKSDPETDEKSYAWMKFNLAEIPTLNSLTSAKLRIFIAESNLSNLSLDVVSSDWIENTLTWNNMPIDGKILDLVQIITKGQPDYHEFDITEYLRENISIDNNVISFQLRSEMITDITYVYSKENEINKPAQLLLVFDGIEILNDAIETVVALEQNRTWTNVAYAESLVNFLRDTKDKEDLKSRIETAITLLEALPPVAKDVNISGALRSGRNLTGGYTYIDPRTVPEGNSKYRWLLSSGGGYSPILGAISRSLNISSNYEGKYIKFEVIPINQNNVEGTPVTSRAFLIPSGSQPISMPSRSKGTTGGFEPVIQDTKTSELPKREFKDIQHHWARDEIKWMTDRDVVKGMDEHLFAPDNNITRAEFVSMMVRALELDTITYAGLFDDVDNDQWYSDVIQTALDTGFVSGSDGLFRPNSFITREEMTKIVVESYKMLSDNNNIPDNRGIRQFDDEEEISDWAREYVRQASELGVIKGINIRRFAPKANATRAQAVVITKRVMENAIQK